MGSAGRLRLVLYGIRNFSGVFSLVYLDMEL